ncbi:transcriptional regulator (plasmid) [Streptomyces sp. NBC_00390]|uniref:transcriptional regulator n=1 Tax=Streptomyces sp. NBC_00390 TaxID=2975736 RepID=UPI002E1F4BBC
MQQQGRPAAAVKAEAVNVATGEVVQLELMGDDALRGLREPRTPIPPRYDWRPHPGRHVNVGKALLAKVWHKDSGYDQNARDILGFYIAHAPEGGEPLRMTFKEISQTLGVQPNTVQQCITQLHAGGLLLEKEKIGRVKFFALNPRAAYDGSAAAQVAATKEARHPVVPAPTAASPKRTRRKVS